MWLDSASKWVHSILRKMDRLSWYSLICGSTFMIWLFFYGIHRALNSRGRRLTTSFIQRHLFYPYLFPRVPFVGTSTRYEAFMVFLWLLINILVISVGERTKIEPRSATMSIINLIPLLCGSRLSLATRLLGISFRTSVSSHQWLGRTAIAQMLIHTVVMVRHSPFTWTTQNITGTVASSALGLIFIFSIRFVRRNLYEWFLNLHLVFTAAVLIALWGHLSPKEPAAFFLQLGFCLWAIATAANWGMFTYRNVVLGKPFATAVACRLPWTKGPIDPLGVLKVVVTVPRAWRVTAGQSVFLSIPALGIFTGLRGHPFMISWWERDREGLRISLLVKSRAGFTARLDEQKDKSLLAFIDGPYSVRYNFGSYGTVIMLATGIGIAGHIPYIKDLIRGYNNCEVETRRIRLIWEIQEQCQELWVKSWMDELLENDTGFVLFLRLIT